MKIQILSAALLGLATIASAAPISTGTAAPWQVNGNPVVVETTIATPFWINNFGDGRWVGTTATDGAYTSVTDGALPGTYTFTLNIGAYIGAAGSFSLQYAADNIVEWSITNGTLSGASSCTSLTDCFSGVNGAPRSLSGSFASNSVLTAVVTNTTSARTPMGLIAVGTADPTGPTPEPSTYAMLSLGGAAVVIARLRRK